MAVPMVLDEGTLHVLPASPFPIFRPRAPLENVGVGGKGSEVLGLQPGCHLPRASVDELAREQPTGLSPTSTHKGGDSCQQGVSKPVKSHPRACNSCSGDFWVRGLVLNRVLGGAAAPRGAAACAVHAHLSQGEDGPTESREEHGNVQFSFI